MKGGEHSMGKDNNLDQIELPEMSADMDAEAEGRYKEMNAY